MEIIDGTGTTNLAKVDKEHRLCTFGVNITNAHNEIHEGRMFEVVVAQITANSDDNMTAITFRTDADKIEYHMFASATTSGQSWFYIYEAPTVVDGGGTSSVTAFNCNRNSLNKASVWDLSTSPDTQGAVTYWDETDAAGANLTLGDGILIHQELLGAGRTSFAQSRSTGERLLKPYTHYAFVLENEGAAANIHNIVLNWYELKIVNFKESENG